MFILIDNWPLLYKHTKTIPIYNKTVGQNDSQVCPLRAFGVVEEPRDEATITYCIAFTTAVDWNRIDLTTYEYSNAYRQGIWDGALARTQLWPDRPLILL